MTLRCASFVWPGNHSLASTWLESFISLLKGGLFFFFFNHSSFSVSIAWNLHVMAGLLADILDQDDRKKGSEV